MGDRIFIYGTLDPQIAPDAIAPAVRTLQFVGRGFVYGRLYDLGEYPGAKLGGTSHKIHGRVYTLPSDNRVLRDLDAYEEVTADEPETSLYLRIRTSVKLENGETSEAWIYEYNRDVSGATLIDGGDYTKFDAEAG